MTHIIVIIYTPSFVSAKSFQLMQIFLLNFTFFTSKSPCVTQRSVSQENAFKKSKNSRFFR